MTDQRIQQEAICYQWFKQRLILSVSEPSISQRSQIKEDTVEPSVPAREFNLKAYAAITRHNDPASPGFEHRLANHRSQAARTATLPIAPPRQAPFVSIVIWVIFCKVNAAFSLGITRWYVERRTSDSIPWRAESLGENTRKNGYCWSIAKHREAKNRHVGKRCWLERKRESRPVSSSCSGAVT